MAKKLTKPSSTVTPSRVSNWFDIDRSIESFRKEMEKAKTRSVLNGILFYDKILYGDE